MPKPVIARWDNALALRIPDEDASRSGLSEGAEVTLTPWPGGGVLVRPVSAAAMRLEDLVAAIRPANLHGEADWGSGEGAEAW